MRIIAGTLKGRKLQPPKDDRIRPTSDRTRESIFNLLMHGQFGGTSIVGQRVADLCCGTGALGLEAISRGASTCYFVDQDKAALALAKQNTMHCNVAAQAQFITADITRLPPLSQPMALVLLDPPYGKNLLPNAYGSLTGQGWIASGTLLVAELPSTTEPPMLDGATLVKSRAYGKKTMIHIWQIT